MKQIIQNLKTGETLLDEVPTPSPGKGSVLVKTIYSLVSIGTERLLTEFGRASYVAKAKQQPDKVKQVLDKMRTDGIKPTMDAVFDKLGQPIPLGYSNVGTVTEVGEGVTSISVGDRVISNGPHAEYVSVPENLVARIPDNVDDESAVFTVVGAIALESIRLCNPTFGESIVVVGLGLIGLLTCELLLANGSHVIAYDIDEEKVRLAKKMGVDAFLAGSDPVGRVNDFTDGRGADGVIITASAKGDEIIHDAAQMSRKRGRIILLGVIGLNIRRDDFYEKELTFQVSCSYGPGRYDPEYEDKGKDYPLPYVRWTEKRNFEAFLQALSRKQIDVTKFISERVPLEEYSKIYDDMGRSGIIASLLTYDQKSKDTHSIDLVSKKIQGAKPAVSIIGAGNFVSSTILPNLKKTNALLDTIVSAKGMSAATLGKKYGFQSASTSFKGTLGNSYAELFIISTRHNLHAQQVMDALSAGKHVFVEKPLCLNEDELDGIIRIHNDNPRTVVVGFNRRFSPYAAKLKSLLSGSVMNINATMNAGYIPPDSWVQDLEVGGGRIVGEACHFIDLCSYLTGSNVISVCMNSMGKELETGTDNASILLKYENGSQATINYFANGSKSYSKERIEVFSSNQTFVIDNWKSLKGYGVKGFSRMKGRQQKGHQQQFELLIQRLKNGGEPIIPFESIVNTTRATFATLESLKAHRWVDLSS